MAVLLVIFMAGVSIAGDYFLKLAGNGTKFIDFKFFFIGGIIFTLSTIGWFFALKYVKLGTAGIVYGVSVTLLAVAIGSLCFDERLNIYEVVGVVSGIFSIFLLARFA